MGRSLMPSLSAVFAASSRNCSVTMLRVGIPSLSMPQESWIHHDVHPPQSPDALTMKSAHCDMRFRFSAGLP